VRFGTATHADLAAPNAKGSAHSRPGTFGQCPFAPILLKKSKIERFPKSRESRCLDVSTAAMLARGDTKVRGRFCERRCGFSRRGKRNGSAVLKNSGKDFFNSIRQKRPFTEDGRGRLTGRASRKLPLGVRFAKSSASASIAHSGNMIGIR